MNWQTSVKMDNDDLEAQLEGILFAAGEPVQISRISAVLEIEESRVREAALRLKDYYSFDRRGIRLVIIENALQLCSSPEYADIIRLTLEKRKPPQLTQTALEVLSIIAYFQPVTRAYIESIRGVDSSYTVGVLQDRGLIEKSGTLQVPGRPSLYSTTSVFMRTFGIQSLSELPELPEVVGESESRSLIQSAIEALSNKDDEQEAPGASDLIVPAAAEDDALGQENSPSGENNIE